MTRDEFINGYCERSNIPLEELSKSMVALACHCAEKECEGWAMVRNDPESISIHNQLYA